MSEETSSSSTSSSRSGIQMKRRSPNSENSSKATTITEAATTAKVSGSTSASNVTDNDDDPEKSVEENGCKRRCKTSPNNNETPKANLDCIGDTLKEEIAGLMEYEEQSSVPANDGVTLTASVPPNLPNNESPMGVEKVDSSKADLSVNCNATSTSTTTTNSSGSTTTASDSNLKTLDCNETAGDANNSAASNSASNSSIAIISRRQRQRQNRIGRRSYRSRPLDNSSDSSSTSSEEDAVEAATTTTTNGNQVAESDDDSDRVPARILSSSSSSSEDDDEDDVASMQELTSIPTSEADSNEEEDEDDVLEMFDDMYDNTTRAGETACQESSRTKVSGLVEEVLEKNKPACTWNTIYEVMRREYGLPNRFQRTWQQRGTFNARFYASQFVVERIKLLKCLRKHNGCVNSLNFNKSGNLLCSGSDDRRVVVWDWAHEKIKHVFWSGHKENIFQTKFINCDSSSLDIVSAGRDGQVRRTIIPSSGKPITNCLYKHRNAVHRLVICPNSPHEILSVGEDGFIRHSDLRSDPNSTSLAKVLSDSRKRVRLFSISHHPFAPEVCVCGSDEFVRVYDKRKFVEPMHKMCPSHLANKSNSQVTCCTYNHIGSEVLATYSDEQIYLFDNKSYLDGSFMHVYRGHYNHLTIKGVNFFGPNSEYVISGSDCGNIFFWDKNTEAILNFMTGDSIGVVNCLEPHPHIPVLATSGLNRSVKIWTPGSERTTPDKNKIKSCIRYNILRSTLEGHNDNIDMTISDFILEALHPDVGFDSESSVSDISGIEDGRDINDLTFSSNSSSTSGNSQSLNANESDDSSDTGPLDRPTCRTQ